MTGAVGEGYATVGTDAGLRGTQVDPTNWGLIREGNVHLHLLQNMASARFLSHEDYDRIAHMSTQIYESIIGTKDPDLSAF